MDLNVIFFIGPQGSGKGTQAKILAKKLDFFYWEMGGMLRGMKDENTDLARKVTDMINQGILLPDDILLEVVKQKLDEIPAGKGVIFDGIPRRIGQAKFLMDYLKGQGRKDFTTLYISLPREESMKRLLLRAQKEGRVDDTPEKIEFRLQQYEKDTIPVLEYFRKETNFIEINGQPPIEEVAKSINEALGLA